MVFVCHRTNRWRKKKTIVGEGPVGEKVHRV
jgi:hypothetical protein